MSKCDEFVLALFTCFSQTVDIVGQEKMNIDFIGIRAHGDHVAGWEICLIGFFSRRRKRIQAHSHTVRFVRMQNDRSIFNETSRFTEWINIDYVYV